MDELQVYYLDKSLVGPWPFPDFPKRIEMYGTAWDKTAPFTQLADFFQDNVVAGYHQDVEGIGRSHHMTVIREQTGEYGYVVDHRESSPDHHLMEHAVEATKDFARKHPVITLIALGTLAVVAVKALSKT